jgi:hypothetical protein
MCPRSNDELTNVSTRTSTSAQQPRSIAIQHCQASMQHRQQGVAAAARDSNRDVHVRTHMHVNRMTICASSFPYTCTAPRSAAKFQAFHLAARRTVDREHTRCAHANSVNYLKFLAMILLQHGTLMRVRTRGNMRDNEGERAREGRPGERHERNSIPPARLRAAKGEERCDVRKVSSAETGRLLILIAVPVVERVVAALLLQTNEGQREASARGTPLLMSAFARSQPLAPMHAQVISVPPGRGGGRVEERVYEGAVGRGARSMPLAIDLRGADQHNRPRSASAWCESWREQLGRNRLRIHERAHGQLGGSEPRIVFRERRTAEHHRKRLGKARSIGSLPSPPDVCAATAERRRRRGAHGRSSSGSGIGGRSRHVDERRSCELATRQSQQLPRQCDGKPSEVHLSAPMCALVCEPLPS